MAPSLSPPTGTAGFLSAVGNRNDEMEQLDLAPKNGCDMGRASVAEVCRLTMNTVLGISQPEIDQTEFGSPSHELNGRLDQGHPFFVGSGSLSCHTKAKADM
jgi:hypothetical protein